MVAENRPEAPDLFARELSHVLTLATVAPHASASYSSASGAAYRRLLLPRARNHVYFVIDAERATLVVHAVWGGPRRDGPVLP